MENNQKMRGLWQMREEAELACPFWATEDLKRFVRNRFGLRDSAPDLQTSERTAAQCVVLGALGLGFEPL